MILRPPMLVQGCSELAATAARRAVQRSASAGAVRPLALLTDGGRYVYAAGSSYPDAGSGSPDNDFTNRAPRLRPRT